MRSKKLLVGVAPLLVTAAFVVMPAVAQAVSTNPHWYKNGSEIGNPAEGGAPGEKIPTVTWGELANKGNAAAGEGEITCKNVVGGFATNPGTAAELEKKEGGTGEGMTQEFASYECKGNLPCAPGHEQALPVPLSLNGGNGGVYPDQGWPNKIEGTGTTARVNTTGVEVEIGCVEPPEFKTVTGATFVTSAGAKQNPLGPEGIRKGSSCNAPGKTEFDAGTGELEVKGSGGVAKGRTTGTLKTCGYEEQELIQIKTP